MRDIKEHQSYDFIKDIIVLPAISIGNGDWTIKDINPEIKTLDIQSRFKPDYINNFEKDLCFVPETYNTVISLNMLEHTKHPYKIIKNAYNLLKLNGNLIISVPFKTDYHPAPHDYWRFSLEGLVLLCEEEGFKTEYIEYFNNNTRVRGIFKK